MSAGSELFALNQSTGAITWGPVVVGADASLADDSATLFVMSATTQLGFVEALNPLTGSVKWNGTLNAISASTNTVLWSFTGDGTLGTAPIGINQYVVVGASSGNLYVLNSTSGATVWQVNLGARQATR